jgi:hypothetical protein
MAIVTIVVSPSPTQATLIWTVSANVVLNRCNEYPTAAL